MAMLYVGIGMLVCGLLVVLGGILTSNKAKRILAAPFRKTGEVASNPGVADAKGMVSCEGVVKTQQPLNAPCSNQPCVYYHLKIEKKVRETKSGPNGVQTTTRWKNVSDQHYGSSFQLDDGSGAVTVQAQNGLDADLQQTFSGPPPGGQGLGVLTNLVASALLGGPEQVLEYRATEKIIGLNSNLFAMGKLSGGQITKPDGSGGKLIVSTRGRDGLVGATKRLAMILMILGGVVAAGGVPVMILKPGEAAACTALKDEQIGECGVKTTVVEKERTQSDGSKKKETFQEQILKWEVTKASKYELAIRQTPNAKGKAYPVIQIENSIGFPVNIGINAGFLSGDTASDFKTKTASLVPGTYTVYVWANKDGPSSFLLKIKDIGTGGAASGSPATSSAQAAPAMKSH